MSITTNASAMVKLGGLAALRASVPAFALLVGAASIANAADIVIGASVPLSGPLAGFGSFLSWGYKQAVADVNKAGGIEVNGKKEQIKLILLDDMTNPNLTASNTETLINRDHVVAMLGSCTPALVNAGALVAERHRIPLVTGCDPLEAFKFGAQMAVGVGYFLSRARSCCCAVSHTDRSQRRDQQEGRYSSRQRPRRTSGRRTDLARDCEEQRL